MKRVGQRLLIGIVFAVAGALLRFVAEQGNAAAFATDSGSLGLPTLDRGRLPPAPAFASLPSNTPNVATWNMCGGTNNCDSNAFAPTLQLVADVDDSPSKPRGVSTQEMCGQQYNDSLAALSANWGYAGSYYASNANAVGCTGGFHGNGVFWKNGFRSAGSNDYNTQQSPSNPEPLGRGWVCGRAQDIDYIACSTHMAVPDNFAYFQSVEFQDLLNGKNNNSPKPKTYGAGDFNIEPGVAFGGYTIPQRFFLSGYAEGGASPTHDSDVKLDYVMVPTNNHWCINPGGGATEYHNPPKISDHFFYWAYANFC